MTAVVDFSCEWVQLDSFCRRWTRGTGCQFFSAGLHGFCEIRGRCDFVDQPPGLGAFTLDAVGIGAEKVGEVAADSTFVHDAREATGSGKNAEQRSFRQANCAGAIIDQEKFVTGEGEL